MTPDESGRLAALFLKSAHETPDRVADRDGGGAMTYAEVAAAASDLAARPRGAPCTAHAADHGRV
ncbi:hypothetical protein [Streptomyces sp. NPDC054863]